MLIGISSVFVLIIGICIYFYLSKDNSDNEMYTSNIEDEKENSVGGFLTLMLETEAGSGVYEKSISSTWPEDGYIFNSELSSCENGGELSWNEELDAVNLKTNTSERCYVYFDKKVTLASICTNGDKLNDCLLKYYNATGDMDNGLYYHDVNLTNGAGDSSYRYAGANPDNYVCLGEDCSDEKNLYRIIGSFNQSGNYKVKLIKNTSIGNYPWDTNCYGDDFSMTSLYNLLETTFISSLGEIGDFISYSSFVQNKIWLSDNKTPRMLHLSEQVYVSDMDIGLMDVVDYGFAASNNYWTIDMESYSIASNNNWMYTGNNDELTVTAINVEGSMPMYIYIIESNGDIANGNVNDGLPSFAVRPVFYLNPDLTYVSGDGSKENSLIIDYK